MAFDPDKLLAKLESKPSPTPAPGGSPAPSIGGFDPDALLNKLETKPRKEAPTFADKAKEVGSGLLSGASNALTFGHIPQIAAAIETRSISGPEYVQFRDLVAQQQSEEASKSPGSTLAGTVAGSLVPAGVVAKGVGGLVKGATLLPKLARGAIGGAVTGAATSPEDVPGQVSTLQLKERLKQGGIGMLFGAGAELGAAQLGKLKDTLKEYAGAQAIKSLGPTKGQVKKLIQKDQIDDVANFVLGQGVLKGGGKADDIYAATQQIRKDAGKKLGQLYDDILEVQTNPNAPNIYNPELLGKLNTAGFKPVTDGKILSEKLAESLKGRAQSSQAMAKVNEVLGNFAEVGDNISPEQAAKMKGDLDALINYNKELKDLPLAQQSLKEVRDFIKGKIDEQAELFGQILGKNKGQELKELLKTYGDARKVEALVEGKIAGDQVNGFFSLTDYISGSTGFVAGALGGEGDLESRLTRGAKTALALGTANKLARTFSPSVQARGAQFLSNIKGPPGFAGAAAGQLAPQGVSLLPREKK